MSLTLKAIAITAASLNPIAQDSTSSNIILAQSDSSVFTYKPGKGEAPPGIQGVPTYKQWAESDVGKRFIGGLEQMQQAFNLGARISKFVPDVPKDFPVLDKHNNVSSYNPAGYLDLVQGGLDQYCGDISAPYTPKEAKDCTASSLVTTTYKISLDFIQNAIPNQQHLNEKEKAALSKFVSNACEGNFRRIAGKPKDFVEPITGLLMGKDASQTTLWTVFSDVCLRSIDVAADAAGVDFVPESMKEIQGYTSQLMTPVQPDNTINFTYPRD